LLQALPAHASAASTYDAGKGNKSKGWTGKDGKDEGAAGKEKGKGKKLSEAVQSSWEWNQGSWPDSSQSQSSAAD